MNTVDLKSIMRLFALYSLVSGNEENGQFDGYVSEYLIQVLGPVEKEEYLTLYNFHKKIYLGRYENKFSSSLGLKAVMIALQLRAKISLAHKIRIVAFLLSHKVDLLKYDQVSDFLHTITLQLGLFERTYSKISEFIHQNMINNKQNIVYYIMMNKLTDF